MVHSVFSVVAPVDPAKADALRALIDAHQPDVNPYMLEHYPGERPLPLVITPDLLPDLHFASLVVFDSQPLGNGRRTMAYLVLQCCIDGPIDDFLAALQFEDERQGHRLRCVFARCADYKDGTSLAAYLRAHIRIPDLLHIGIPGMRRSHVRSGRELRAALDARLDDIVAGGRAGDDPIQIVEELKNHVGVPESASGQLHFTANGWVSDPYNPWPSRIIHWSRLIAATVLSAGVLLVLLWLAWRTAGLLGVLLAVGAMVALGIAIWMWLHGHDPTPIVLDAEKLAASKEREDHEVQNHMCTFTLIRDTLLRRLAARLVLRVFNLSYRTVFTDLTPGRLLNLPTIHFAHWTIVPVLDDEQNPTGREVLMFLSNYDGSWDAYLDDFLLFLLTGVVAIWASCEGFRWPLNPATFKAYARNGMTPWQSWYVGEPKLTVLNIQNNDQIRRGLLQPMLAPEQARLWLTRLGAIKSGHEIIPETPSIPPPADLQGIVLSGYRHLPYSSYALLRIGDVGETRQWLRRVVPHVTDARHEPDEGQRGSSALNIAFTWHGLVRLGLPRSASEAFPLVFQEGVAPARHAHRSRALGDVGDSAPSEWQWGGDAEERRVDILLMFYARSPHELAEMEAVYLGPSTNPAVHAFANQCGTIVARVDGQFIASRGRGRMAKYPAEHFGFVDGISQPRIQGTWHTGRAEREGPNDVIKPGEFVLGYAAENGWITPGIDLAAADDPERRLPLSRSGNGARDFGRNGSFLVARQLRQHVARFRQHVSAVQLMTGAALQGSDAVGARLVGRAPDGMPLADASADRPNDFTFAADPHGFRCPIGAHVRRANPRDSLGDDSVAALKMMRRRRLLRRGRTYGPPLPEGVVDDDGVDRGIMFIALNTDIERQFEFVQQTWINNTAFSGLYSERDPIVGDSRPAEDDLFTVQGNSVRERLLGLDRFVTVAGADYFFLPGLRALRYLASVTTAPALVNGAAVIPTPERAAVIPTPVPKPVLARAVEGIERALPVLSLLWAVRFPTLLAAALLLIPLAGTGSIGIAGRSFFLTDRAGLAIVATLASMAAFVVMITLRLVLLYGQRIGLGRSRWRTPARWIEVGLFQLLALPVVLACIHWTATDAAWTPGARSNTAAYIDQWTRLAPFALLGFGITIVMLDIATWVQGLRPGARPELMFPANVFTAAVGARRHRLPPHGVLSRVLTRGSSALVAHVPPSLGAGFIDYSTGRLLPGHAFAAALAAVVAIVYAVGCVALSPLWSRWLAGQVPSIAYLLFLMIAAGWLLSSTAFFLDRYRLSTIVLVIAWLTLTSSIASTDHYFAVGDRIGPGVTPREAVLAANSHYGVQPAPDRHNRIVLVMSEGQGLISSAWTARVLTSLAQPDPAGTSFTRSLRLLSASSGAAVGTLYFVNEYRPDGFLFGSLGAIRSDAAHPSSGEGGWGFVYPDFIRTFAPLLVPKTIDRGWAMEQVWRRPFVVDPEATEPMLSKWRDEVKAGWRPATAFGATIIETGQHALIATYDASSDTLDGRRRDGSVVTGGHDISLVTAARLSAAFPFISPPARPERREDNQDVPAYHIIDSGVSDNSGWTAVREWLRSAQDVLKYTDVMLVDIRSLAPGEPSGANSDRAWQLEVTAPLESLVRARDARHRQVSSDIAAFNTAWKDSRHAGITHVIFALDDAGAPLTWNLGAADDARMTAAWRRNASNANQVWQFVGGN